MADRRHSATSTLRVNLEARPASGERYATRSTALHFLGEERRSVPESRTAHNGIAHHASGKRQSLDSFLAFAVSSASNVSSIACRSSSRDGLLSLSAISLR